MLRGRVWETKRFPTSIRRAGFARPRKRDAEDKPGVSNLMDIYGCVTGKSYEEIEREFDGRGYGDFKLAVGEAVAQGLEPLQKKYREIMEDKSYLDSVISANDEKAAAYAAKTLRKVQKKVGLTEKLRRS